MQMILGSRNRCLHTHKVIAWLANAMCVVTTYARLIAEITGHAAAGIQCGQV